MDRDRKNATTMMSAMMIQPVNSVDGIEMSHTAIPGGR
jgi:hypothetical protein